MKWFWLKRFRVSVCCGQTVSLRGFWVLWTPKILLLYMKYIHRGLTVLRFVKTLTYLCTLIFGALLFGCVMYTNTAQKLIYEPNSLPDQGLNRRFLYVIALDT